MGFQRKKKKDSNLIQVGAIWDQESKAGAWYGSGSFSRDAFEGLDLEHFHANLTDYTLKLFTVPEEYKKGDSSPSLRLYIAPKEEKSGPAKTTPKFAKKPTAPKKVVEPATDKADDEAEESSDSNKLPWE